MASHLAWLDHDAAARERMQRLLARLSDKEARDELGLGTIRDSIADQLFPGTSTIQTRLRYMLFVPWIYSALEADRVSSSDIEKRARKLETQLVEPLLAADDQSGVFGKRMRGDIKRLPNSVYWAGLGSWGIRKFYGSRDDYHRAFDALRRGRHVRDELRREDGEAPRFRQETWHPSLPAPPAGFPASVSLALTRDEATWICERILEKHETSLLGFLAKAGLPDGVEAPWELASEPHVSLHNRTLLEHARRFSLVAEGAALVYNYALAVLPNTDGKPRRPAQATELGASLKRWCADVKRSDVRDWSLVELWEVVRAPGHAVTRKTKDFVEAWMHVAREPSFDRLTSEGTLKLVRSRELDLKGRARSRFLNENAYRKWNGAAGLTPLVYRWPTVVRLLGDLADGLRSA